MNCTASVQAPAEGAIHSTSVRVEGGCQSEPLSPALSPPDGERERAAAEPSTNCQRNWRLSGTVLWSMTLKRKGARWPPGSGGAGWGGGACAWPKMDDPLAPAADPHAAIRRGLNAIDRVLRKSVAMIELRPRYAVSNKESLYCGDPKAVGAILGDVEAAQSAQNRIIGQPVGVEGKVAADHHRPIEGRNQDASVGQRLNATHVRGGQQRGEIGHRAIGETMKTDNRTREPNRTVGPSLGCMDRANPSPRRHFGVGLAAHPWRTSKPQLSGRGSRQGEGRHVLRHWLEPRRHSGFSTPGLVADDLCVGVGKEQSAVLVAEERSR